MQTDSRRITVAQEHLRAAYDEVTLSMGSAEQSVAQAACSRAISHLDLVLRKIEDERSRVDSRSELGAHVEAIMSATRAAWQCLHDICNFWQRGHSMTLDAVRNQLMEAMDACEEAEVVPRRAEMFAAA